VLRSGLGMAFVCLNCGFSKIINNFKSSQGYMLFLKLHNSSTDQIYYKIFIQQF
jgi:hypothetical protein